MTTIRVVLPQPDRRYWRRRANSRVRKRRWARNASRWAGVIAIHAALVGVVIYVAGLGLRALTLAPELAVQQIDVQGTRRSPADAIRVRLAGIVGRNLLELDLDAIAREVARDPWIAGATAKRILPATLRVSVVEREPAAIAILGQTPQVIDATGQVIGPSGPDLPDDLPVLTGLDSAERDARLARGAASLARLRTLADPWVATVSELDLSEADRIAVRTMQPGPTLLLDPARVERNLDQYLAARPEIERRVGPLAQVDLRWSDRIAVLPAAAAAPSSSSQPSDENR